MCQRVLFPWGYSDGRRSSAHIFLVVGEEILEASSPDSPSVLLCPTPSLCPLSRLQAACHRLKLWPELQDHGGDYVSAALGPLTTLLEQGLGSRLHLLAHSRPPVSEVRWSRLGSL